MVDAPTKVEIHCTPDLQGAFVMDANELDHPIWTRLKLAIRTKKIEHTISDDRIHLSWPDTLTIVRELGSRSNQQSLNFRFLPQGDATLRLKQFAAEVQTARTQRETLTTNISVEEITERLTSVGFTKRRLKEFQERDLQHLLSLSNGANFSVPGAGKTTVTFALHMLVRQPDHHFIVVAPKAAVQAWLDVIDECIDADETNTDALESFTILEGREKDIAASLRSGARRFIISYDLMIRQQGLLSAHFATPPTHLVLDESHRMKAGWKSQRGAFLLNVAPLLVRRDILTGTPMPQAASDIESQLDFCGQATALA